LKLFKDILIAGDTKIVGTYYTLVSGREDYYSSLTTELYIGIPYDAAVKPSVRFAYGRDPYAP
jgi:hypothetical protein